MNPLDVRFDPAYPLSDLRPADYNPRRLSEASFVRLQGSLRRHGVVKPVILNADGTLVAGHQRTKGLKAIGQETVPAMILPQKVRLQDEIKFNLLHNRVETESSVVYAEAGPIGQWCWIPWQTIEVVASKNIPFQQAIGFMTAGHGPWGSVVIDDQGRVVLNAEYAAVAKAQRFDVLAWTVASFDAGQLVEDLTGEYGVYDWTGLEEQAPVWNQHIVQPNRLREHSSKAKADQVRYKSETWEQLVLPWLTTGHRVVDFGAGHGDYARHLKAQGYQVHDYEPYRTLKGKYSLDIRGIVGMIRTIERDLRERGLYEVVVLDSVINATTSLEYQHWVLLTVNALCAKDGTVAIGTRNLHREQAYENSEHSISRDAERLKFLDSENVDMRFVRGKWQRIRYHTPESLRGLLSRYFEEVELSDATRATLKAVCRKPRAFPAEEYEEAFRNEFNMPYPNGHRHDKHFGIVEILIELIKERNAHSEG
ncbi:ParB N-terminal domain-containing protein [Streptomyces sp. PCS3-D2]|uniref:methyltransferase domain-containing protein n=1 Tax=Streptomyces sp. PCS3-D2 TaxID=1460244 RepID=UPI000445D2B7|nr:ParB N-terminal domain-containing protein [Streptomyces sp. PCS3-D2]WKV74174.1 ParB N-terminal domain-containing protein [Streptomyces sp. PCS3-D2]